MKFQIKLYPDRVDLGDEYMREKIKKFAKNYPQGLRAEIVPYIPESRNLRRYFEGAVIPMWVYLDNKDWRDNAIVRGYREIAKQEFCGEIVSTGGKAYRVGTTKGQLARVTEETVQYLEDHYGIDRIKVLNPENYKNWRDMTYPLGGPDNYISYLIAVGKLK
jgi:hypothetical protein